jgi:hypothetical protein
MNAAANSDTWPITATEMGSSCALTFNFYAGLVTGSLFLLGVGLEPIYLSGRSAQTRRRHT